MASKSLIFRSAAVLALTSRASAFFTNDTTSASLGSVYVLSETYAGESFFSNFDFWNEADPTHGFVNYLDQATATEDGLVSISENGVYVGVDHHTVLSSSGTGRDSVRLTSKNSWTHGLFVADIEHMPGGACGIWPAMWTFGPDWPYNGEIDIIEGVNSQYHNQATLHAGSDCTVSPNHQTGTQVSTNCNNFETSTSGCGNTSPLRSSYGLGFNDNHGGIYAMDWTSSYIRIYFFPRGTQPGDIHGEHPDPSAWGPPVADFEGGGCDFDAEFSNHSLIFDTTFCGDWAGSVFSTDAVCAPLADTCADYVAGNPGAFADMYWLINSVKIYELQSIASPLPSVTLSIPDIIPTNIPTPSISIDIDVSLSISFPEPTTAPAASLSSYYAEMTQNLGNPTAAPIIGIGRGGSCDDCEGIFDQIADISLPRTLSVDEDVVGVTSAAATSVPSIAREISFPRTLSVDGVYADVPGSYYTPSVAVAASSAVATATALPVAAGVQNGEGWGNGTALLRGTGTVGKPLATGVGSGSGEGSGATNSVNSTRILEFEGAAAARFGGVRFGALTLGVVVGILVLL